MRRASVLLIAFAALLGACRNAVGPDGPAQIAPLGHSSPTGTVGATLGAPLVFRVSDARGRPVAGVRVSFAATGGAVVQPASAVTSETGEAATQVTLGTVAGPVEITASAQDVATPARVTVTAAPGPATRLAFVNPPSAAEAGLAIAPAVRIAVQDAHGNVVASPVYTVSVALGENPGSASLAGTTSVTSVSGIATFSDLVLDRTAAGYTLEAVAPGLPSAVSQPFAVAAGPALDDRPDDISGPQVHVIYVLPSDAPDRRLDRNGTLHRSVASFHTWFMQRSGGLAFRFDTYQGELDVTYARLSRTDAEIKASGAMVVREIELELAQRGRLHPDKLYLVYYDGGSTYACGGASWPPHVAGRTAAMYLQGTPPGATCGAVSFVPSATSFPQYWEFAALHDLIHVLGIVSQAAPNHVASYPAHVPDRHDLMYGGAEGWILGSTTVIDVAGDDYHGAGVPAGLPTLEGSPYIVRLPMAAFPELSAPAPDAAARLADLVSRLPVHEPLARP